MLPDAPYCGITEEYRIASHGEHPWSVIINKSGKVHCGGSVINPQFILTGKSTRHSYIGNSINFSIAAHCFKEENVNVTEYKVEFGRWKTNVGDIDCSDQDDYEACDSYFDIPPTKIIKHEGFVNDEDQMSTDDIAIVKLKWPLMYTNLVRPICLPSTDDELHKDDVVVLTGFGKRLKSSSLF